MENKEEILKALQTIKNICKEYSDCDPCPLAKGGYYGLRDRAPDSWKIKSTDTWKAFED